SAVADRDRSDADVTAGLGVPVAIALAAPLDLLGELIHRIDPARRVHPAGMRIEPLVDKELPPGRGAIDVQPFVARYLLLGTEIPAGVRVDQQQRAAAGRELRRDGDTVGALALVVEGIATS